jgi:hypothetical protein
MQKKLNRRMGPDPIGFYCADFFARKPAAALSDA